MAVRFVIRQKTWRQDRRIWHHFSCVVKVWQSSEVLITQSDSGLDCNQDCINLISRVMKCSELTRLLWSHSAQDRGQAVCVFSFASAINDGGSTWSVRLVTGQPGSIQQGSEVWAFGNQRSFGISAHKCLELISDWAWYDASNGRNGLHLGHPTHNFTSNALCPDGVACSQTDATFILVTPA